MVKPLNVLDSRNPAKVCSNQKLGPIRCSDCQPEKSRSCLTLSVVCAGCARVPPFLDTRRKTWTLLFPDFAVIVDG